MSDPVTANINASVQKTYEWLNDVQEALPNGGRQAAYHAARSVLHALRDRLTAEEAAHLAAELPSPLRGVYYEGWSPAGKPDKMKRPEFLDRVRRELESAPGPSDPEASTRAVLTMLQKRIAAGEISDVRSVLPGDFADLWPTAS